MNKTVVPQWKSIGHFVGGRAIGVSEPTADVFDPATGRVAAKVALGGSSQIVRAVEEAKKSFADWSDTPPVVRAKIMFRFRDLVERHVDELACIISSEHGKIRSDAKGEVVRGLEVVEFACGIPHLLKGEHSEQVGRGIDSWSVRQPIGVVAGITPFNFPVMVPMWMFPVAIACGNTFVLKPSERDPSASVRLAELFHEAGLPAGVFNVVHGGKQAVDAILSHRDIEAVSFVGSTPVAEHVYRTATAQGKRVQALGGAKNHMVVMPDADLKIAADALMGAAYGSAGERCMAISVAVVIGDEVGDALVSELTKRIAELKVGPGSDGSSEMGPLVTREHLDRVADFVRIGQEEGAELIVDGRDASILGYENGFFLGACLFDYVTAEMKIYNQEIFGPVLCVMRVPTIAVAMDLVNTHEYGNGATIFTRDGGASQRFARDVKAGMVGINIPVPVPMAFHSFGGWKRSLFGDVAVHGPEGVRFYTRLKTVTSRWPTIASTEGYNFPTMR